MQIVSKGSTDGMFSDKMHYVLLAIGDCWVLVEVLKVAGSAGCWQLSRMVEELEHGNGNVGHKATQQGTA